LISIGEKVVGRSCCNKGKIAKGCQNWFETTKMILMLIFIYFLMGSSTPTWALTLDV